MVRSYDGGVEDFQQPGQPPQAPQRHRSAQSQPVQPQPAPQPVPQPPPAGPRSGQLPPTLLALTTFVLSRVTLRSRRLLGSRLAATGLRLWHLAVLAALADFGPAIQRDLAGRLGIDPSDLVAVLDDLVGAGHVERRRDPADRRRYTVALTAGGTHALAAARRQAAAVQDDVLAPLLPAERQLLHDLLSRVLAHLEPGPDEPPDQAAQPAQVAPPPSDPDRRRR